jgi:transposase
MEREQLESMLAQGMSAAQIGERVGKAEDTVFYWIRKYGLNAANSAKHQARGAISRDVLVELVESDKSLAEIAIEVGRSVGTVRHWLRVYELETRRTPGRRSRRIAHSQGMTVCSFECPTHGMTEFVLERRGFFRCRKCRLEAVSRWRRKAKQTLVDEAGGVCVLCGYDRCVRALEFHHVDPSQKSFAISVTGGARSLERLRAEAAKCVLLCANCHGEVEAGFVELPIKCASSNARE